MGVESVFRHAFEAGNEYAAEWEAYESASARGEVVEIPRRDLRLEAIRDILAGDIWVHSHGYRSDELLRLLTVAEDYGFRIATLQHVLEGYRIAPEMVAHGVGGSTFADWWSYKKEAYDAIPYNAAMMMNAGVLTSLNSDSHDLIRHLNFEAGKTMRFGGLTEGEAMRLITINPAKQLGLDGQIGSIEVGKDADFAVFTGHPLDTHSRNMLTLVEGEIFFQYPGFELAGKRDTPDQVFMPTPPRGPLEIPEPNSMYAITNATIHPVSSSALSDVTLVIQDGRILDILEGTSFPVGASVMDADGLHVYPGLINSATQMGLTEIASLDETRDSRDLSTYQPELRALSGINPHSEHIPVSMVEGITLSNALPQGGIISGRGSAIQMSGWTVPEMLRSDETGLVIDLPVLPSKHTPGIDKKRYEEMLEKHENSMAKTEEFIRNSQHYAKVNARDQHSEMHVRYESMMPYVTGEKPVFFRAQTYKEILQALKFAEVFELRPVILGGAEAYKLADTLAEKKVPVIITSVFRLPSPRASRLDSYERFDAFYSNPARLEDAGVLFAIASTGAEFAKQLPTHAGFAVAHGLSKDAALKSITINPARILGLGESVGSIEMGKTADLIITTGDPTRTTTRTVAVFIKGQPRILDSIHERNREKFTSRPDPGLANVESLRGPPALRVR
jgi:imidazolonepropionase-like amidohydrolase